VADRIVVTGLELWGYHGVFDHEKRDGQRFLIDLDIELDTAGAAGSDDVADTLNYAELIDAVETVVTGEPVDLIETLAAKVLSVVWEFPQPATATVTVHKPGAPVSQKVADIAVTVTRNRPESTP
jgi:dihydroneopterin aldolase